MVCAAVDGEALAVAAVAASAEGAPWCFNDKPRRNLLQLRGDAGSTVLMQTPAAGRSAAVDQQWIGKRRWEKEVCHMYIIIYQKLGTCN